MAAHMGQSIESIKEKIPPGLVFFGQAAQRAVRRLFRSFGCCLGAGAQQGRGQGFRPPVMALNRGMFVVIGLIVAFILIAVFSNRATRYCRWRERRGDGDSTWTCIHCGATVRGARGQPPSDCYRDRPPPLG